MCSVEEDVALVIIKTAANNISNNFHFLLSTKGIAWLRRSQQSAFNIMLDFIMQLVLYQLKPAYNKSLI